MTAIVDGESLPSSPDGTLRSRSIHTEFNGWNQDFRSDIEGLRAVAILVIVGYHAGIPGFSGGFIGVDVFFVVSGYLITRRLLHDSTRAGAVPFGDFWARRIRRLVPGLAVMVVATLLVGLAIINPFDMLETAKEGGASALYVSNILFAQNTQNYFGSNPNKSPFLHTWSLGVEEQFYLIWPFFVLGLLLLCRHRRDLTRQAALVLFAVVFVASFALNLVWTNQGSAWAFFSLPTRAWEFAAGGFLGSLAVRRRTNHFFMGATGFLGLALLIGATELFNSSTTYPGMNALLPVAGTVLLIVAGTGASSLRVSPVSHLLSLRPMLWTGRMSYSWYLWHWPFIVLAVLALNTDSTLIRSSAALASLGAAYLAFRYVESPIRFAKRITRPTYRTYVLGLAITLGVLCVAGGTWLVSSERTPTSLNAQLTDAAAGFFPGCHPKTAPGGAFYCFGGDLSATTTVALVGDSHSASWFNAMKSVAAHERVRVLLLTNPGCPFIPVEVLPEANGPLDTKECVADRSSGMALLSTIKPAAIVLTQHSGTYLGYIMDGSGNVPSQNEQVALWKQAFQSFIRHETALGVRVGVILDNPTLPQSPAECVSQTDSIAECEPSRAIALGPNRLLGGAELQVLDHLAVPYVTPDSVLCTASGCPLELDGRILYVDSNHLSYGATQLLEPQLETLLRSLIGTQP